MGVAQCYHSVLVLAQEIQGPGFNLYHYTKQMKNRWLVK